MAEVEVIMGDSRDVLKTLGDCSIDSVVCDPPYALVSITKRFGKPGSKPAKGDVYQRAASGFMSQTWDTGETAFAVEFWAEVMRVLKPGGVVLDPFAGSGSTGVACIAEGFDAILIEREAEYVADIRRRVAWAQGEGRLTAQEMAKKPDLGLEGLSLFE